MSKKIIFVILTALLTLSSTKLAQAQNANCAAFSVDPSTVVVGEPATVTKSDGLLADQLVRVRILDTNIAPQTLDCDESPQLCSGNPTSLIQLDTSSLEQNRSYTVEIFFSDGLNTCTTSRSMATTGQQSTFCSPQGLTEVSPTRIQPNEDVGFSGCLGAGTNPTNPCNQESKIVVFNAQNVGILEVPIGGSIGSCDQEGYFYRSFGGLGMGVYTAQLYIGTSPSGGRLGFDVGSGDDPAPEEGNPCSVVQSGFVCSGTYQYTEGIGTKCVYDQDQCLSCAQCSPPACTDYLKSMCVASLSSTAGKVSEGCTEGPGYVNSAVGCIPFDVINRTAAFFLAWGIGIGGGVSLLVMSIASFQFALSGGNPQRVQSAKSLFMSALGGMLFLLLSVFLLRFIGVDVLGLFS